MTAVHPPFLCCPPPLFGSPLPCSQHAARQIWDDLIVSHGMGVYPLGAILNHSCKPNCVIYYHPETHEQVRVWLLSHSLTSRSLLQEFRCIEDIQVGEEICHSYIGEEP